MSENVCHLIGNIKVISNRNQGRFLITIVWKMETELKRNKTNVTVGIEAFFFFEHTNWE